MAQPVLEMKNIHKRFSSTIALDGVDLAVYPGEIRGLIGENGSGKSTISSIAAGMQKADEGTMLFKGSPWAPASMVKALKQGLGMIVQEQGTVPGISIAENIFLGESAQFAKGPFVHHKKMLRAARAVLAKVGLQYIDPSLPMAALNLQDRKLVEIAKVISYEPELFVVDETTTALSQTGRNTIYELMQQQKAAGKSVLFISHDLEELMEVCDTLTVLRDGKLIRSFAKNEFDGDAIRISMIGRTLQGDYYRSDYTPTREEQVALKARHITVGNELKDISLDFYKGEIVGIGGLSHCGMHTLGKVLFGAQKPDAGSVMTGDETPIASEVVAMKQNIGYVAKDRDVESLCLSASIRDNIAIAGMDRYAVNNLFILNKNEIRYVDAQINGLSIKCSDRDQQASQLSGGNKQKMVFGKWIGRGSDILILDCPTRGVDIGVKQAMYQLMVKLKNEGKTIVMISEEMPELLGMSDRLLIMKNGCIAKEFARSRDLSDADIIRYMI